MMTNGLGLIRKVPLGVSALVFGSVAAGLIIALFQAEKAVAVSVIGGILFIVFLAISGNPRLFCLWGLILTAPLELGKKFDPIPHMGGAGAYTIELVDIFIVLLVIFIFRDFVRGYRRHLRWSWVTVFWGGMIALGMLTVISGPLRTVASHEVVRMLKCLLLFLVLINELNRTKQFVHAFGALAVSLGVQSLIGLAEFFLKSDLGLQVLGEATKGSIELTSEATYAGGAGVYRVGALLGHPNLLAGFVVLILPMCITILFSPAKQLHKVGSGIVAALGVAVLILTLSRTGWVDFGVAFMVLLGLSFVHPRIRTRFLIGRAVMLGLVGVMVIAFSGPILKRLTHSDPGAVNFRYEFMEVAWKMIETKPVLGFGLNSFVFRMGPYTKYSGPRQLTEKFGPNWPVVHDIYLLTWAEQGTVGFVFFVGLLLYLLWRGFRNVRYFDNEILYAINIGCIGALLAIMVDGVTSFYIRNPGPARIFWIVAALIVAIAYWQKENRPLIEARRTASHSGRQVGEVQPA